MMRQSDQVDLLNTALAAFQGEMEPVNKTQTAEVETKSGRNYSYSYADLADVIKESAKLASRHGLSVTQMPEWVDGTDVLTTRLNHSSGQWIEGTMRLFLSQDNAQGHGSAITYGRRYMYSGALGIAADEDDDGQAGSATPRQTRKRNTRKEEPLPPDVIPVGEAKQKLLEAFKNDVHAFHEAWGNRGDSPVPKEEFERMLAGVPF